MIAKQALEEILYNRPVEGRFNLEVGQEVIPAQVRGTYYLNGPANLRRGDFQYQHWLDGDGFVRALHIGDDEIELVSRFVETRKFCDENDAEAPLYRTFGTSFADDRLRRRMLLETPANVSIFPFGGKLLAFGEQALPWELDPLTLETIGEFNFENQLSEITPFSAHPKIDDARGYLCNFGIKYLLGKTVLCYWEFDEAFTQMVAAQYSWDHSYSVHDFTVCSEYAAFYLCPYELDIASFVKSGKSIHDSLNWKPEEENILFIVPRDTSSGPVSIPLGARGFCLHLIGSYLKGDDLVIDLIETSEPLYPQYRPLPELFATVRPGAFVRITVDPRKGEILTLSEHACPDFHLDFPVQLEGVSDDIWVLAVPVHPHGQAKYFDRLQRFDWSEGFVVEEYKAPEGMFLAGEPVIVGDSDTPRDEVLLVCPLWDSVNRITKFMIFKSYHISKGPVFEMATLDESPLAFHSSYKARV